MKKNYKGLFHSIILFVFSTALIISTLTGLTKIPDHIFFFTIIGLWTFQILGAMGIAVSIKKQKPHYDWTELEEKNVFTISSFTDNSFDGEFMETKPNHFGFMIVDIEGFGKTLMSFPSNLTSWQNKAPLIGKSYMRVENCFFETISKTEE